MLNRSRLALGFRRTAPERHASVASLAGLRGGFALWLTVWLRSRLRAQAETGNSTAILATELIVYAMVSLKVHPGGFLSGVNGGP